jgi:hypothetical protein
MDDGGGGTLADELGGWDEDVEEEEEFDEEDEEEEEEEDGTEGRERDSGIDVASPVVNGTKKSADTGLGIEETEDEEETDGEVEEMRLMMAKLEARISAVESLARRGATEGEDGDVIARTTERLKDLGAQSGIETGVTR